MNYWSAYLVAGLLSGLLLALWGALTVDLWRFGWAGVAAVLSTVLLRREHEEVDA